MLYVIFPLMCQALQDGRTLGFFLDLLLFLLFIKKNNRSKKNIWLCVVFFFYNKYIGGKYVSDLYIFENIGFQKIRKIIIFQNVKFYKNYKRLSQNVESRIPIRDSKFSTSVFTPSGTFIFEKKHILEIPFL